MQENNFLLCLRNPCENTFSKLPIFLYIKKRSKYIRVLAVCNTQENIFFIFFIKTQTSQLDINTKMENSKPSFILQELQET